MNEENKVTIYKSYYNMVEAMKPIIDELNNEIIRHDAKHTKIIEE